MRGQENVKSYPERLNKNLSAHYPLQNEEKRGQRLLTYENSHVPISVSVDDTLEREPTHICDPNSKELISVSSWKSWRGAGKYSNRVKRRVHVGRYSPIHGRAAESRGGIMRSGTGSRF